MTPARKEPNMETYSGRFAARLRELRTKANLTQGELSEALGVKQQTVSQWETASRSPSIDQLPAIVKALHLTKVGELMPDE